MIIFKLNKVLNILLFSLPDDAVPSRMSDLVRGEVLHQPPSQAGLPSGHGLRGQTPNQRRHDHSNAV